MPVAAAAAAPASVAVVAAVPAASVAMPVTDATVSVAVAPAVAAAVPAASVVSPAAQENRRWYTNRDTACSSTHPSFHSTLTIDRTQNSHFTGHAVQLHQIPCTYEKSMPRLHRKLPQSDNRELENEAHPQQSWRHPSVRRGPSAHGPTPSVRGNRTDMEGVTGCEANMR